MNDFRAAFGVYITALATIVFSALWAGIMDWTLFLSGRPTITGFLRANPAYYWYAMAAVAVFLTLLTMHLYLFWGEK